jgi:signal peptidase II
MRGRRHKWALLAALFFGLVLADQWSKYLAVDRLTYALERPEGMSAGEKLRAFYTLRHLEPVATAPHYVWRPVWRMNYVENPGAAWGIFRGFSEGFRTVFFGLVSIAAVVFILNYYRKLREEQRFLQLALAFVLAGAVGNFLDRLARGYVIDFVEWYWWNRPDLRWPTFNVADSLIVVGVTMLVLHPGSSREKARGGSRAAKEAGPA